jgi:hypothetical protein
MTNVAAVELTAGLSCSPQAATARCCACVGLQEGFRERFQPSAICVKVGLLLAMYHEHPFRNGAYPLRQSASPETSVRARISVSFVMGLALVVQRHPDRSHYERW